jgi:hypothetical protein
MNQPKPWERQNDESQKAFEAFKQYAEMGAKRSVRQLGVEQGRGSNPSVLQRWSMAHQWVARAAEFDRHIAALALQAEEKAIEGRAGRWAELAEQLRMQEWEIAQRLIEKAKSILDKLEGEAGSLGEAARLIDLASKLGRLACGVATTTDVPAAPAGNQQTAVVIQLPSNGRDHD